MAVEMLNHNRKLSKALHLLSEAAAARKEEIQEGFDDLKKATENAIEESSENIKKMSSQVNKSVRKNPWPIIGGVAASAALLGYAFGFFKGKK